MTRQLLLPMPEGRSAISLEACKRLAKMVREKRNSFETRQFKKYRDAAKLGWARRRDA